MKTGLTTGLLGAVFLMSAVVAPQGDATVAPPAACSAVATPANLELPLGGKVSDLWFQCDYRVEGFRVSGINRKLLGLVGQPELLRPEAGDVLTCRFKVPKKGAECSGSMSSRTRARVRVRLDKGLCATPRAQLVIKAWGATDCAAPCGGVGFATTTLTSNDRRTLLCQGSA